MSEREEINLELLDKVMGGIAYTCSCGTSIISSDVLAKCPNCGKSYGNHICAKHGVEMTLYPSGTWICPKCKEESIIPH